MIRTGVLFLMVLMLAQPLRAGTPEALMEQANQAYISESYHEAVELYEQIADMQWESDILYYNLGNAYYKTGQVPKAILNYERALRLNPSGDDILHNLRIARSKTGDRPEPMPRLFFIEWHDSFIQLQSVDGWSITSIILVFLFSLCFALYFVIRHRTGKQIFFAASILMILTFCATLYAAHRQYERHYVMQEVIVMSPRVTVKSAPSEGAVDVFVIHEGRKLRITGKLGDWYEVRLPDGNVGWIKKTTVSLI